MKGTTTVYRCSWQEGVPLTEHHVDFYTETAAERYAAKVARKSTERRQVIGYVYAVRIHLDEQETA